MHLGLSMETEGHHANPLEINNSGPHPNSGRFTRSPGLVNSTCSIKSRIYCSRFPKGLQPNDIHTHLPNLGLPHSQTPEPAIQNPAPPHINQSNFRHPHAQDWTPNDTWIRLIISYCIQLSVLLLTSQEPLFKGKVA